MEGLCDTKTLSWFHKERIEKHLDIKEAMCAVRCSKH